MVIGVQGPTVDGEPVEIGRVLAVFEDVVKMEEPSAGVVEHTIEDDLRIPLSMSPVDEAT